MYWTCPVCEYEFLTKEPKNSFEICRQCGVEFGNDDASWTHAELRTIWIRAGHPFWRAAACNRAWAEWYNGLLDKDWNTNGGQSHDDTEAV